MALLDGPFRELAKTLHNVFGASVTLRRSAPGSYNARTGATAPATETDYTVKATPPYPVEIKQQDGTAIATDRYAFTIAAKDLAIVPTPQTDSIVLEDVVRPIELVKPIYSGAEIAAYEIIFVR